MRETMERLVLCIALVAASATNAQTELGSPANVDATIRLKQVGSAEIPDGVAFKIFLDLIAAYAQGDKPVAGDYLQARLGLSADRASKMLGELLDARTSLAEELEQTRQQLLCGAPPNSRKKEELYRLFGTLDDLSDTIADKHLILFTSQVSQSEAERLQQLINLEKSNMGRVQLDHKRVYEQKGADPSNAVADVCSASSGT